MAIVAAVSFVAGSRQDEIVSAVGPMFGVRVIAEEIDTSSLQATYKKLAANYDGELDIPALIEGANRGLVAAVGDDYTVYMNAEEAKQFDRDLSGNIGGGIGAEIGVRNDQPTILRTLADTPAERAGLMAGDVILAVNSTDTRGWSADRTAQEIRGEVGTTVKLTILRGREKEEFSITRAEITNASVESDIREDIGYLTIRRFDANTARSARKAAEEFKRSGVKGIVVDMRGNGGGFLTAAQEVAGLWLNDKVIVSERRGDKVVDELKSGKNPLLLNIPTVILVNQATASASEIVAGALQDYGLATIVGEKTFGKGTVQKLLGLADGAELKVTVARWYTPNGRNITSEGIAPDRDVELSFEDANAGRDPQMDAAVNILSK